MSGRRPIGGHSLFRAVRAQTVLSASAQGSHGSAYHIAELGVDKRETDAVPPLPPGPQPKPYDTSTAPHPESLVWLQMSW